MAVRVREYLFAASGFTPPLASEKIKFIVVEPSEREA
jgi:hypothetical protein